MPAILPDGYPLADWTRIWQAWRTKHLPKRGNYWLCNGSLVHKGFQRAWLDVQSEIMQAIKLVLSQSAVPVLEFDFYVTGEIPSGYLDISSRTTPCLAFVSFDESEEPYQRMLCTWWSITPRRVAHLWKYTQVCIIECESDRIRRQHLSQPLL